MRLDHILEGPTDAPVLVLSSSLGTTRDMWLPQREIWTEEWRLLSFDHPGHGGSPLWNGPVTVEGIGNAVIDLLDTLGMERVSFCGLSLGGMVGQWLAAHHPQRVDRLILCCTSSRLPAEPYVERARVVREKGTAAVADAVLERWFTPAFHAARATDVDYFRQMITAIPDQGYAACCEAVAGFDGRSYLASIVAPTLVIAGAEDMATPVDHARALCEGIGNARLQIVPRAAHLANVEQPEVISTAIRRHVRGETHDG